MNARDIARLFYEEDFRWHMRFERGEVRLFFAPGPESESVLAERRHWLAEAPQQYATLLPNGVHALDEAIELAHCNEALTEAQHATLTGMADPMERCMELGRTWESDFALLAPGNKGGL